VHAQSFPSKSVRIIAPFPPGAGTDTLARTLAGPLTKSLGQSIVVENRPGGGTVVGTEVAARAPADGHTLLIIANSFTINPAVRSKLPYDARKDFSGVARLASTPMVFAVHPSVPAKTLKEFVAHAKANPGKLVYGTGNPLSILYNQQLMNATGISMLHVPYKGEGPLNPDILAGRVQSSFLSTGTAVAYAKDGRLRPLAVLLERRSPLLPDVPTIVEAGAPAVTVRQWAGMFGPPKMPREIVERLNKEVNAALKRPDVLEKLQGYGYAAEGSTPERLLEINRDDLALWRKLVREAGIPLD
jgi:tripartite-type tricarboxylate transporter receptor subunit TctC